jgi:phage-related protein
VVTKLGELVTLIPPAIADAITKIAEWGANMRDKAKEVITLMVTKIIDLAKELPTKIWNAIISCVTKIAEWGVKMQDKAKSAISNVCTSIVNGFKDLPSKMVEIGTNIVQGIWNGINNAKDWILDKIKGFGDAVLSGLKSFFGINSPSRVMRDQVGVYLAQGIGVGFEQEMQKVTKDMQDAIPKEFDVDTGTDTDDWDTDGGSSNSPRQQGGVTVIQNIYANETNYKKQQREAAKNFRLIARTV